MMLWGMPALCGILQWSDGDVDVTFRCVFNLCESRHGK